MTYANILALFMHDPNALYFLAPYDWDPSISIIPESPDRRG